MNMMQSNNSPSPVQPGSLATQMVVGAGIGLLLISVFIIPAEANPAWGKLWMIRPLIITPLAGAMAGLCGYLIISFHELAGLNRTMATIIRLLVLIIGLFLGLVLGMDGTLWN